MADVTYVLPDTLPGEPGEREEFACRSGCDLVECAPGDTPPPALPWLLRMASTDEDGRDWPRWHDRDWMAAFVAEVLAVAERVPAAVTIEPGGEWSRPADLLRAVAALRDGFLARSGSVPMVLVANRAEQSLPDGAALAEFWDYLLRRTPELACHAGIALDAPEFYAATKSRMMAELALIPISALRYVRLHAHGRKPDLGDTLPWRSVFGLIRDAPGTVLIAPAVEVPEALGPAILFCMVSLQSRAFT